MAVIEDVIINVLKGDTRKNALSFVAHLRANEIPLEEADNYWEVKLKDKSVCFMLITGSDEKPGPYTIWSDQEPGSFTYWSDGGGDSARGDIQVDERIKEIAWANVNFCADCGGDCSPGRSKIVLGKKFDNVCSSAMAFTDPDADALLCAKAMVDMRIRDILRG